MHRLTNNCSYSFYFRDIDVEFVDGNLVLHGRVPSFYLKQLLQTRVTDIEGVNRVVNLVDVVNSVGLSSERPAT